MQHKENQAVEDGKESEVASEGASSSGEGQVEREEHSSSSAGTPPKVDPVAEPEEEDFKKKYFYLAAEMDNLSKRFLREKEGIIKFSNERLLTDILDAMDNFDRTLQAISLDQDPKTKNITIGIQMIKNQFMEILKKYGLLEVESIGKIFDPHLHEAVSQREEEGKEDHAVLEELQKGYLLNGRLIRAAKVIVCVAKSAN